MKTAISPITSKLFEKGKHYKISEETEAGFIITEDQIKGATGNAYCLKKRCNHIDKKDWKLVMYENYLPCGDEWKKEMNSFKKADLIDMLSKAFEENLQLKNKAIETSDPKIHISIQGVITKDDQSTFTEEESDLIFDDIIILLGGKHKCSLTGGSVLYTEKELTDMLGSQ